jgi:hypothetical protein
MSWGEIAATLSADPGPSREEALLKAVLSGAAVHRWHPLSVSGEGRTIDIEVSEDALAIGGASDAVRVTVNATTAQLIADHLDALLLTPLVSDRIYERAAVVIEPSPQAPTSDMGSTARMVLHSRAVDAKKRAAGGTGLTANAGKDWVLTNRLLGRPSLSANYGWHVKHSQFAGVTPGVRVLQPLGTAHNRFHVDYSQVWRGMRRACKVDGQATTLDAVLQDPKLAHLLSHEGVLKVLRVGTDGASGAHVTMPQPTFAVPRTLRRGMSGPDVAAWQRVVGVVDDGVFGPGTEDATKAFQALQGLAADGVVGPATRAAIGVLAPFVQAKNFGRGRAQKVDTVVIHTMEAAEKPATAENVAAWFAGASAPNASAHYCVDSDSIVQCVKESDTAFHAPGVNQRSIGIEHAGYAKQSAEDWADSYSETMLRRSAQLVAGICRRHAIPVRFVDEAALVRGEAGITTHAAVSKAFRKSTHTDPGLNFPLAAYLQMVTEYGA